MPYKQLRDMLSHVRLDYFTLWASKTKGSRIAECCISPDRDSILNNPPKLWLNDGQENRNKINLRENQCFVVFEDNKMTTQNGKVTKVDTPYLDMELIFSYNEIPLEVKTTKVRTKRWEM